MNGGIRWTSRDERPDPAATSPAMLRRLSGSPVPPENFIVADVSPDNLGPDQPPPVSPDQEWPEAPD